MKKIIFLFTFIAFVSCGTQKKVVTQKTAAVTKKAVIKKTVVKKVVTATKNMNGNLIGIADKNSFNQVPFQGWFNRNFTNYKIDETTIAEIAKNLENVTVKGFMGTWCGDSKRETPRFYKVMEAAKFDFNSLEMVTVNRSKRTPDNLQAGLQIIRVPTFIFYKNGKEIGRYVEYPRESLEKDILKIVTQQPYKHSYDR